MLFTTSVTRTLKKYHSDSLRRRRERKTKIKMIVIKGMKMRKNRVVKRRKRRKMMRWVKMKMGKPRRKRGDMQRSIML
jgi:hypothetical protein